MNDLAQELRKRYERILLGLLGYENLDQINDPHLLQKMETAVNELQEVVVDQSWIAQRMGITLGSLRTTIAREKGVFPAAVMAKNVYLKSDIEAYILEKKINRVGKGRRANVTNRPTTT